MLFHFFYLIENILRKSTGRNLQVESWRKVYIGLLSCVGIKEGSTCLKHESNERYVRIDEVSFSIKYTGTEKHVFGLDAPEKC